MQIDPHTLARLGNLEITGRTIATGYLHGRHLGQRHGPGTEFSQYRTWQPGDPRRSVDWRLFARTGQLHVREAELETDLRLWLVLDTSASMGVRTPGAPLTKLGFALRLAAALGFLAQQQGDELGLVEMGRQTAVRLPPAAGRDQWYRLLGALDSLDAGGDLVGAESLPLTLLDASEGALIFVLSDFYQQTGELLQNVARLALGNRDLRALCLECEVETRFDLGGARRLRDPESGEIVMTQPPRVRAQYLASRESYLNQVAREIAAAGGRFGRFSVDRPLDESLRRYLMAESAPAP